MRQRHHMDEEASNSPERAPAPVSASKTKKKTKRRRGTNTKLVCFFLLSVSIIAASVFLFLWKQTSNPPLPQLPLRRGLFLPEIGASTKCQKEMKLNRATLDTSLALGTTFLLNHQKEGGNFDYEFDWISLENSNDDSDVRQAGALWGMALIFHDMVDSLSQTTTQTSKTSLDARRKTYPNGNFLF